MVQEQHKSRMLLSRCYTVSAVSNFSLVLSLSPPQLQQHPAMVLLIDAPFGYTEQRGPFVSDNACLGIGGHACPDVRQASNVLTDFPRPPVCSAFGYLPRHIFPRKQEQRQQRPPFPAGLLEGCRRWEQPRLALCATASSAICARRYLSPQPLTPTR